MPVSDQNGAKTLSDRGGTYLYGLYKGIPHRPHILPFTTPFIIGAVTALDMAIYKEILFKADRCYVVLRHKCEWVTD